jgi:hypothetical protein
MLMRFLGLASLIGIIGVAGVAGAITLRGDKATNVTETSSGNVALRQEGRSTPLRRMRPLAPTPAPAVEEAPAETTPVVTAPVAGTRSTEDASLLGQGRTVLTDSIYAIRAGDSVVVNFDTFGNRTRRADKFEQIVRTTLPMVYGRRVAPALDSIPSGSLLPSRDVIGELAAEGIHLRLDNGTRIRLWPRTRASNDGPLVVSYLVVVER